jgi:NADH:ubiquinone oxidoreductase subunit 6 (subunit J)
MLHVSSSLHSANPGLRRRHHGADHFHHHAAQFEERRVAGSARRAVAPLLTATLCAVVAFGAIQVFGDIKPAPVELTTNFGNMDGVGRLMLSSWVYPFKAISLILLVAVVGGVAGQENHPAWSVSINTCT